MAKYLPLIITALSASCATSPDYVFPVSPGRLVDKVGCEAGKNTRYGVCVADLDGFIRFHKEQDSSSPSNREGVTKPEFIGLYERLIVDLDALRYSIATSENEPVAGTPLSGTPISRIEFAYIKRELSRRFDSIDLNGDGSIDEKDDVNGDNRITAEDIF